MYEGRANFARFEGKNLMNPEGMKAVHSLREAHEGLSDAEKLNARRIKELTTQINELTIARNELNQERAQAVFDQRSACNAHTGELEAFVAPVQPGNNPVYAATIRAVASDGQRALGRPQTLANADEMGQSFVALDAHLRKSTSTHPVLIVDRESAYYANLYLGKTKRRTSLKPGTIKAEAMVRDSKIKEDRMALNLPVRSTPEHAFQISSYMFGSEDAPLTQFEYGRGPRLRNIQDAFKFLLPQGCIHNLKQIGSYDTDEGVSPIVAAETSVSVAIGRRSVRHALYQLALDFEKEHPQPHAGRMFDKVGKLLLGTGFVRG